jgi:hypothetical protein
MKRIAIFLIFLNFLSIVNLLAMESDPSVEIYDDGEVLIHEGDGFFPEGEQIAEPVDQDQVNQISNQIKKQNWFTKLVQKIKGSKELICTQRGFSILLGGIVLGYSMVIKFGYDPLNIYPVVERFVVDYDKIGVR